MLRKASFLPAKTLEEIYYKMVIPKVTYGMLVWGTCTQNKFEKIENQHVRAARLIKNIPRTVGSNRVLDKVGWDPIIHIYKRKVAIQMYKILEEEYEQRLGSGFRKSKIREGKLEVARLNSEFQRYTFNYRGILIWNEISNTTKKANSKQIFRTKLKEDKDRLRMLNFSKGTVCVRNRCEDFIYY